MKITPAIRNALEALMAANRVSPYDLAPDWGVNASTIGRWRSGATKSMSNATWLRVRQSLEPFLETGTVGLFQPSELVRTPVVGLAAAAGYRAAIGTAEFIEQYESDAVAWEPVPPGHLLPPGTIIEVNFNVWPKSGEIALALTTMNELPVLKYYDRKDYRVYLDAIDEDDPDAHSYQVDLKVRDGDAIHWAHPVVRYSAAPPTRRKRR